MAYLHNFLSVVACHFQAPELTMAAIFFCFIALIQLQLASGDWMNIIIDDVFFLFIYSSLNLETTKCLTIKIESIMSNASNCLNDMLRNYIVLWPRKHRNEVEMALLQCISPFEWLCVLLLFHFIHSSAVHAFVACRIEYLQYINNQVTNGEQSTCSVVKFILNLMDPKWSNWSVKCTQQSPMIQFNSIVVWWRLRELAPCHIIYSLARKPE